MATVNKNFRIKDGLIVEGTTGTINGEDILTTGFTTDSLDEGSTNQYYTESRAKTDAAELLTGATLTNITITGDGNGLTITAENGVADSTTSDLAEGTNLYYTDQRVDDYINASIDTDDVSEGSTNLYFTDQRAIDAVGGSATSLNTPNTVVKRDGNGDFAAGQITANLTGDVTGNADTATALETARTIELTGNVTGSVSFDGTGNVQISTTIDSSFATDAEVATAKSEAISTAEAYTDNAVAGLVDSAPALLDTLNELAAAINDDANFASTIGTSIGEKVSKAGDTMTGELVLAADPTQALAAATKQYADSVATDAYNDAILTAAGTAQTYANTAEQNAKDYADGLAVNYDAAGSAATAETNANTYTDNSINALDTDDIEEGSTNLYFTDTRAVDALEAVVPNFTAVDVNSLAKQVAATTTSLGSVQAVAYSFAKATYRTAKFIVKIDNGTHNEVTEVLLTLDSSDNIAITEYAIVGTNGSRGTITAGINGLNVEVLVTPVNDSDITLTGTLLA